MKTDSEIGAIKCRKKYEEEMRNTKNLRIILILEEVKDNLA